MQTRKPTNIYIYANIIHLYYPWRQDAWMMGIHACIWRRTIDLAGRSNGIKYGQRIAFERGNVNCTQPAIIQRNENSTGFVRNIETRTPQETILGVNTLFTYIDDVSSMETWPLARWLTCPLNFAFFSLSELCFVNATKINYDYSMTRQNTMSSDCRNNSY